MKRIFIIFVIMVSWLSLSACVLTKAVEEYDEKDCDVIRKIAENDLLYKRETGSLKPGDDNSIAKAFFDQRHKADDIDRQARRLSYKQRCR